LAARARRAARVRLEARRSSSPRMRRGGDDADELWAAVADPTRRKLLDALLAHGEATATTLAGDVPVTRQAVAKHLSVLERAGLVDSRRLGREVRYAVRPERLDAATEWLARVAAEWDERLAALKRAPRGR